MAWLRLHSGPDARTSIKKKKGGIFRSRFFQSVLMPHTAIRNAVQAIRHKPMTQKEGMLGFLGF